MYMDSKMGNYLAELLTAGYSVKDSWFEMNRVYPGPNTTPSNPTTAVSYVLSGHDNDRIWDEGSVSSSRGTGHGIGWTCYWSTITSPPAWWDGEIV